MKWRDDLVSLEHGGRIAGVSRPTMKVYALEGRIRSELIAGRLFVRRDDCERMAEAGQRVDPTAQGAVMGGRRSVESPAPACAEVARVA